MAETPVWPAEHDAKIREAAAEMGDNAAIDVLDKLKDILGHAPKMEQYGDIWAPETTGHLTEAQEDFDLCVTHINNVWQGPAAEAFNAWASKYRLSLIDFKALVDSMRRALYECSGTIIEVYKMAINLVATIASQIVKFTTGIIGAIPNVMDVADVIGGLLGAFIEQAGKLIGDGLSRLYEFRTIMSEVETRVAGLADLVPMGPVVAEKGGWVVTPVS